MQKPIPLLGLPIQNVTMEEAVEWVIHLLKGDEFYSVYFINAHCVNVAQHDSYYREILIGNAFNFADGVGMQLAARLLHAPLKANVNGTDMFPRLCQALQELSPSPRVFLLGGESGVAQALCANMQKRYPHIHICGAHHGHFGQDENEKVLRAIQAAKTDLLLVAMGVPRQEKWIARYGAASGAKAALGVGGLFNFYSGRIPRAPLWMRRTGLEWLHRLWQEPTRLWRRYLIGNGLFLACALRYKCFKR